MRSLRALLAIALLLVGLGAAPAAAHSDDGTMTVTAATAQGLRAHLEVGVLYTDEDLAEEATVTATLRGPGGASVGPVTLAHLSGAVYGADVELPAPGEWTATITSTGPKALATATITATASPTTTAEATTSTTEAPEVTVPATREEPAPEGSNVTPWIIAGVLAVVLAAGIGVAVARRRARS